jgi:hypothetical protein
MSIDTAQPAIDCNARFGSPRIQRYSIDERLRLSVEYRVSGWIAAIEIAPAGYRGFNPLQPPEMRSEIADRILEKLVPEITINGSVSEIIVGSTYPGFSREVRTIARDVTNP